MMRHGSIAIVAAIGALLLSISAVHAQGSPQVIWEAPTPSGLGNSVLGVAWSPGASGRVAVASTDRWVRTRQASNGTLIYSVLQPHRSGGADQVIYSTEGVYLAIHNRSGGLGYRIHRSADGAFLGDLNVTLDGNGLIRFTASPQLIDAVGGASKLPIWRVSDFTVIHTVGSGYSRVTTVFNFSPNGAYQSAASRGSIKIQRRGDAAVIRTIAGGPVAGASVAAFTPDSTRIAAFSTNPNQTTLWRISDGIALMRFSGDASDEGVIAIRFSPDGLRLVTTGYLPFVDGDGLWQQKGVIRFWRVADGALRRKYDARTGLGVTSPLGWSPDASRFIYGTYEGAAVVAVTPVP
jgi:WD40 repeat protein